MAHKGRQMERREAGDVAKEFIDEDLLPEDIEDDVIQHLDRDEPVRALRIILQYRKGRF
jgi:hypothetical protein